MEINERKFSHGMAAMLNGMAEVFESIGCCNVTAAVDKIDLTHVTTEMETDHEKTPRPRQRKRNAPAVSSDDNGGGNEDTVTDNVPFAATPDTPPDKQENEQEMVADRQEDAAEDTQEETAENEQSETESSDAQFSVTLDDITKVILTKLKRNRENSSKLESILKTYNVNNIKELPPEKYEAFLTDISEV